MYCKASLATSGYGLGSLIPLLESQALPPRGSTLCDPLTHNTNNFKKTNNFQHHYPITVYLNLHSFASRFGVDTHARQVFSSSSLCSVSHSSSFHVPHAPLMSETLYSQNHPSPVTRLNELFRFAL